MTESTLLFYFYIENVLQETLSSDRLESQKCLINWLYSTSGFYDKTITGSYFDFPHIVCKNSPVYIKYMNELMNFFLKNKEKGIVNNLHFHDLPFHCRDILKSFKNYLSLSDYKNDYLKNVFNDYKQFKDFVRDKNIVIINPMSELMKSQYETGNINHIYEDFPEIKSIICYKNPYTFFNKGDDENILSTKEKIVEEVKEIIKDIEDPHIIISCGAYSNIIANEFEKVCTIGGFLLVYFGIRHKRYSLFLPYGNTEYWVNVPDELKPLNYEKIEEGCFW
jgi:hypothetical protein